ncbi:MAG: glycosyltransferase [Ignavibacteriae bacterium]|nr:glycosyltransferase [Ignavibacteriota bacterium]MCB9215657.1 glycosyltransferase [Ignavibacteria bacterium]
MLIYQVAISLLLLIPLAIAIWNSFAFARIRRNDLSRLMPKVSVLIPARNEEGNIAACISSLLHQTYPNLEVIVLNDSSEDRTEEILLKLRERRPELTILRGLPLPPGWIGKNWACHQLSAACSGELLVFTDADTVHRPESIASLVAFAERSGVSFFSGVPLQRMDSFWENVVIPMTQFLYFAYLPNRWITTKRDPRFSATNGQLLCTTRTAYNAIGGHEQVKEVIIEDVALGHRAKKLGIRTALAAAVDTVECKMYGSLSEIIAGFSKNFFPGLGYNWMLLIGFVLFTLALYIAPLGFLVAGILQGNFSLTLFWMPISQLTTGITIRLLTARTFKQERRYTLLHPLSSLMAIIIGINSARLSLRKGGMVWKGRVYSSS